MNIKATIAKGDDSTAVYADITADGLDCGEVKLMPDRQGNYRRWGGLNWAAPTVVRWLDTLDDPAAAVAEIERVVTEAAASQRLADALNTYKDAAWKAGQLDRTKAPADEREAAHDASDAAQDRWRSLLSAYPEKSAEKPAVS